MIKNEIYKYKKLLFLLMIVSIIGLVYHFLFNIRTINLSVTSNQDICESDLSINEKIPLYSKYPELENFAKNKCVWLGDVSEVQVGLKTPVLVFEAYPADCGSCGTRETYAMYKNKTTLIDSGHEITHKIIKQNNGMDKIEITYGLLEPGDCNSCYKWSMVNQYQWDSKKMDFTKLSETKKLSPYNK